MSDDDAYGPALPPWIAKKKDTKAKEDDTEETYGPSLPPNLNKTNKSNDEYYDVPLPPHLKQKKDDNINEEKLNEYFPELPPHLIKKNHNKNTPKDTKINDKNKQDLDEYTVPLPPHLLQKKHSNNTQSGESVEDENQICGPMLPPNYKDRKEDYFNQHKEYHIEESENKSEDENEEDDYIVGPLPSSSSFDKKLYVEKLIEQRAANMKNKLTSKPEEKKLERESWMTELPDGKPNLFGLGIAPRQFRKKAVELGDRSVWTDTPQDKERKAKDMDKSKTKEEAEVTPENIAAKKRDEELEKKVSEYNSIKRANPLIDLHQVKVKKKKEEESGERRPFSREVDLNVNKFDEAQKSAILKKARHLDDRFSSGNRKFL